MSVLNFTEDQTLCIESLDELTDKTTFRLQAMNSSGDHHV